MFAYRCLIFYVISLTILSASGLCIDKIVKHVGGEPIKSVINSEDTDLIKNKDNTTEQAAEEKVKIELYYECLCPYCRAFDRNHLTPTVRKLGEKYLDIHLYPYGNAETTVYDNGTIEIECQHGVPECYGNMLHACAIDQLKPLTKAIYYISCLMGTSQSHGGSNDEAADKCGTQMNIDSEPIKTCAKGPKGLELAKYYGDETNKIDFHGVPHVVVNGVEYEGDDFFHDVCEIFAHTPPECTE
ncbi:GILT-like protein 2 [Anticarsia gemmatalis]|uniref:GILT-like protein 2 n=1 Tax=Anticarsia gemmatalis TaxID=129554 RepID=UPI003F761582